MEQTQKQTAATFTGTMSIMGPEGDTKLMWDKSKPVEVGVARDTFAKLRKEGYLVYRVVGESGDKGEMLTEFDPAAERLIAAPPMKGG